MAMYPIVLWPSCDNTVSNSPGLTTPAAPWPRNLVVVAQRAAAGPSLTLLGWVEHEWTHWTFELCKENCVRKFELRHFNSLGIYRTRLRQFTQSWTVPASGCSSRTCWWQSPSPRARISASNLMKRSRSFRRQKRLTRGWWRIMADGFPTTGAEFGHFPPTNGSWCVFVFNLSGSVQSSWFNEWFWWSLMGIAHCLLMTTIVTTVYPQVLYIINDDLWWLPPLRGPTLGRQLGLQRTGSSWRSSGKWSVDAAWPHLWTIYRYWLVVLVSL